VIQAAWSLAKNATSRAASSGSPTLRVENLVESSCFSSSVIQPVSSRAGIDGVYGHTFVAHLGRECSGEGLDSALGRGVGELPGHGAEGLPAGEVDDPAAGFAVETLGEHDREQRRGP
jgi:hypothetical protein